MKTQTKYFGELEYDQDDVVTFPIGMFGFEDEHEFLLIPFEGSCETLLSLQSLKTPALSFTVMTPFSLDPDYAPELQPSELKALGVAENGELGYYVLCAVKDPVAESTVNLKCPIAINVDTRVARQVILESDRYEMRHPLSLFRDGKGAASC